jgi:hypothetical protein
MNEINKSQQKPAIKQTWLRILLFVLMYIIGSGLISILAILQRVLAENAPSKAVSPSVQVAVKR